MNAFSKIDMGEVTRLTQAGKLAEAMALLQGHTASSIARGGPGSETSSARAASHRSSLASPCRSSRSSLPTQHESMWRVSRRAVRRRRSWRPANPAELAQVRRSGLPIGLAFQCRRQLRTCATGAGPRAGRGSIRGADLLERRGKSDIQGVRAQRLYGPVSPGRGHAARLHSEPRRLRRWHTDE
jgi:hypothetical protein